jgi:hypothetical protein
MVLSQHQLTPNEHEAEQPADKPPAQPHPPQQWRKDVT